jgi:hypothetical protein
MRYPDDLTQSRNVSHSHEAVFDFSNGLDPSKRFGQKNSEPSNPQPGVS